LRYGYEVRGEASYFEEIPDLQLPEEMRDLAQVIIQNKAGHFNPDDFTDRYEDAVVQLIRAKQAGMPAKAPEQPSRAGNVVNIMDALRRSIAAAGGPAAEPGARSVAQAPAAPRPKAPSKAKDGAAKAPPAAAIPKARKAK
jgi:DNA end-binding protein Ku